MKVLKFFTKMIFACLLLILIFWAIALGTLQTKQGQAWAISRLIAYLENKTQTEIQIGKIYFSFPLGLQLEDVSLSQDDHLILSIKDLEIRCSLPHIVQGRLVFSKLQASNLAIQQLFQRTKPASNQSSRSWDAPPLPFYVKLENINIQQVRLGPDIINMLDLPDDIRQILQSSFFNFQGMVSNNPFRGSLTAHLLITAKSEHSDLTPYCLGIDTQNHQLSLSLHCRDFSLQTLAADLPSQLKAHLALSASAPVSSWQNLAQNVPQQDISPIEGHFKLSLDSTVEDATLLSSLIGQQASLRGRYLLRSKTEVELLDLKIDHPNYSMEGDAVLTHDFTIQNGNFKGEIENLDRFQPWLGKDMQGKITFEGHVSGPFKSPSLILSCDSPRLMLSQHLFQNVHSSVRTSFESKSWNGFLTLALDYHNTPWKGETFFDWNNHQHFTFYQLQVNGMRSHLEGEVTCYSPDYIWKGALEARISNLNDLSHFFDIPISGEGVLKLHLAPVLDVNQQKRQGIQAALIGKSLRWIDGQAEQLTLNVDIDPIQKGAQFFDVRSHLEGQQVSWKDYFIGEINANSTHQVDAIQLNLSHLATEWKAQDVQWPMGKAARVEGQARLHNPLQVIEGTIQIYVQNMQTPMTHLEELAGSSTFHPSQKQWPFQFNGRGTWKDHFQIAAEGYWHFTSDSIEIQANRLSGQFGPYPLYLKRPVHFMSRLQGMQLAGLHLQFGEAEIQGEFHLDQQQVLSTFKTNDIPSELFHYIVPELPLTGRATFQGRLEGLVHEPRGQFQIDLHQIQIVEDIFANKPLIGGRVHLDLNAKGMQVNSELNGIGHTPLLVSGNLPISLSLNPFDFKTDAQLPFNLALNAEGELDPYLHLFYNDTTNLSGHAKIALRLTGQMNAPQIQGHVDLVNGAYESLSTGALYHNIQAHLEGDGSKIVLKQFSAQDNKQGSIAATGLLALDAAKQFPFEFKITPSHIFILDSDYAGISASGPLNLIGNLKQSKLSGELTIDKAVVHLEETLPRQIKTVDVKYINLAEGEHHPNVLEKKEKNSTVELDIKLQAPQDIVIEGNHLKSEWKGSLAVTGTTDNPQLHGDLRITQGSYDLNGKVFNLNQGNIHFAGAPDKKTTLYIVASKEIDRINAEIIVKGPVTKPVISFRSNPPLSQREVLSYILFNRGISDITTGQGDQLSQSFMSLNSSEQQTKASDDFLSRLRNNIGIDRLDFTTNSTENKDIGLQVGKNITENITVTVNQSMTSVSPIIAVEAKLRKNLKAQAETGVIADAPVKMSLKWKKDY